jgi:protein translocase SecG subunit
MIVIHYVGWVLFFCSAVLLTIVVLLQEAKGGGLAEAFGGMGAETFGVKSGGINRFTFTLAAIFCGSAILISSTWNV